jgi:hypothetical protein
MRQYSLLKVLSPFSLNPQLYRLPDSILTVLVITRLTSSQTGPLHPATVTGRKAHIGLLLLPVLSRRHEPQPESLARAAP